MFNGFPMPKPDSGGGGSSVKSVRRASGWVSMGTGVPSLNVAIDPVDDNSSIVLIKSYPQEHNVNVNRWTISGELTSPTNVFLQRTDNGSPAICFFDVVELQDLKSFQKGTVTVSGGATLVTIDPVDLLKTVVFVNFRTILAYPWCSHRFTNATTLRFDQPVNPSVLGDTKIVNYYVAEFN